MQSLDCVGKHIHSICKPLATPCNGPDMLVKGELCVKPDPKPPDDQGGLLGDFSPISSGKSDGGVVATTVFPQVVQ
jgi:hypothetical protein